MSGTAGDGGEEPTNEQPAAQAVKQRRFLSPAELARFLGALDVGRGVPTSLALQETGTAKASDSHKARREAKRERRSGKKEG